MIVNQFTSANIHLFRYVQSHFTATFNKEQGKLQISVFVSIVLNLYNLELNNQMFFLIVFP